MEQVTVTLSGSASEIREIINEWIGIQRRETSVPDQAASGTENVEAFVRKLTKDGRLVVQEVATNSSDGQRTYEDKVVALVEVQTKQEFYGVMGGIGIHWSQCCDSDNPFRRVWDHQAQRGYFLIERDLAERILRALGAAS